MEYVMTGLLSLIGLAVYLLPSLIAFHRGTDNRWLVLVINVIFGATFLGWVVALVLALRKPKVPSVA
ncbi:superinfection immunity protein [Streptomyces sp. NBC_00385]|uniref:superinfection immunity protein n=1 Tax=Streptomyces sp. NBC_00385 TaxID=2975733 RepID=UPI002DD8C0EC|nr:superinfection immunity protein [Streptomyces sp. NBC_00385]WRZ05303.1 superinfection immunity protein [Streptomyces sp. NBC_00385]